LRGAYMSDSVNLAPVVAQAIHADDTITVKGSLSMNMNHIVTALKAQDASTQQKIAS